MMDIPKILQHIRPREQWTLHGTDYKDIQWLDSTAPPTLEELEAGDIELQKLGYRDKRRPEYPSVGDQLDALWKGGQAAADMLEQIQAIKDKYPKP